MKFAFSQIIIKKNNLHNFKFIYISFSQNFLEILVILMSITQVKILLALLFKLIDIMYFFNYESKNNINNNTRSFIFFLKVVFIY